MRRSARSWVMRGLMALLALVVIALLGVGAVFLWGGWQRDRLLSQARDIHRTEIEVPWPLSAEEAAALRLATPDVDVEAVAWERAVERGAHLARARGACVTCHGEDLGGGTMLDEPMVMRIFGPNLTSGPGSVTRDFTAADWERAVRHGVRRDGTTTLMPGIEIFATWSDREVSDVIAYARSVPAVDRTMEPSALGPVGTVLYATGQLDFGALAAVDHAAPHASEPPPEAADARYGAHIAVMCAGCHGPTFHGGPVPHADPSWGPAADLTSSGLQGWGVDDFRVLLREGRRPDGSPARPPMNDIVKTTRHFTDLEIEALWAYFRTLPGKPSPP